MLVDERRTYVVNIRDEQTLPPLPQISAASAARRFKLRERSKLLLGKRGEPASNSASQTADFSLRRPRTDA